MLFSAVIFITEKYSALSCAYERYVNFLDFLH